MAALTTVRRKALSNSAFAIPSQRRFPIDTRARAANALARVSQTGTAREKTQVRRAVCRKFSDFPTCKRR